MAITVGTDGYISIAEAVAHADSVGASFDGVVADQEAALRRATRWVDATYRIRFSGYKTAKRTQSLEWPRTDAEDANGEEIPVDEIPVEIKDATAEAAIRELAKPGVLAPDVVPGEQKVLTQVGEISWTSLASGGADAQRPVVSVIDGILAPLIGGKTNRLLRS